MTRTADIIAQIERTTSLAELAALGDMAVTDFGAQQAAIAAATAAIAPLVALAAASFSTLPQVVSFVTSLQSALCGPAVAADAILAGQAGEVTAGIAAVAAAVAEAEARIND